MSVLGIDFGNHTCKMAVARKGGVEVVMNEICNRKTPSFVAYGNKQRLVGDEAIQGQMRNFSNTIDQVKRLVGRKMNSPDFQSEINHQPPYFFYKLDKDQSNDVVIPVEHNEEMLFLSPNQVLSALFSRLKDIAEKFIEGQSIKDCVISVPSYWNAYQRQCLFVAATSANLNILRVMNETTAVALNYGLLRPLPKEAFTVLFYDMGHCHTNTSLVTFCEGKLNVIGTQSHRLLGGRDFDVALIKHFTVLIEKKYGINPLGKPKPMLRLWKGIEAIKKVLSSNTEAPLNIECLIEDFDVRFMVKRSDFEDICKDLLDQAILPVKQLFESTGFNIKDLHSVEVIGGSSRIPAVRKLLSQYLEKELMFTCNADESVAKGCALQAAMLSPNFKVKEFEVHDITPFPIELAWGPIDGPEENSCELISPFNPIPNLKLITFHRNSQPFQIIARYSKCNIVPPDFGNHNIASFEISGCPQSENEQKIKVKVKIDINGLLCVTSAQLIENTEEEEKKGKTDEKLNENKEVSGKNENEKECEKKSKIENEKECEKKNVSPDVTKPETQPQPSDQSQTTEPKTTTSPPTSTPPDSSQPPTATPTEPEKKKKKRIDLTVVSKICGEIPSKVLSELIEFEAKMLHQDQVIIETSNARNELESYILEMRSHIQGELKAYISPQQLNDFLKQLDENEDWLCNTEEGENGQKSFYTTRTKHLKTIGDKVISRQYEHLNRDTVITALKSRIVQYQMFSKTNEEKYQHISDEERKKVFDKCTEIDHWLANLLVKIDKLSKHEDPPVTIIEIKKKNTELCNFADPIINTPKPKPPPIVEEPETSDKKETTDSENKKGESTNESKSEKKVEKPENKNVEIKEVKDDDPMDLD